MARPTGVPQTASAPTQQQGCNCGSKPTTPPGQPPTAMQSVANRILPSYAPPSRSGFGTGSMTGGSMQVARPYAQPTLFGGSPSGAPSPQMDTLFGEAIRRMF